MTNTLSKVAALVALVGLLPLASAAEITPGSIYELTICQGDVCVATYSVPYDPAGWKPDGTYMWELGQDVDIMGDGTGERVATLQALSASGHKTYVQVVPPGAQGRSTPQVNLGFAMLAGDQPTQFTVQAAEVTFASFNNPDARANATFSVGDGFDDGASLTGLLANSKSYEAQYNGQAPAGTTFSQLIDPIALPPNGGTTGAFDEFPVGGGFTPILDTVSSMSSIVSFEVTPNDFASGTSTFEIVPEPASIVLLALVTILRRR